MRTRSPLFALPLALLGLLAIFLATGANNAHASPTVTTDKPDYVPTETVIISGNGYGPGDVLDVAVIRPDGAIVTGDGSGTAGWDTVVTTPSGEFTHSYILDGVIGEYTVQVYASPWNGPESFDIPMAITTFTDFTTLSININSGAYSTDSLLVSILASWSGAGGDPTQARFANDLSPEGDCADLGGGVFGPWQSVIEIGTSNTASFAHTLAAQTETGLRRVCSQVAQGTLGSPVNTLTANDLIFYRVPNPALAESCGLDMVIVMDSSGSMSATELAQMKSALTFYTGAFLPETPTEIAIVEFDSSAAITQPFTNNETALNTAINAAVSGGNTNWDDALAKADSLFPHRPNPDLVVLASDGNPNMRGGHTHLGHSAALANVSEQNAMSWASAEANELRTEGVRIVALGIGDGLDTNNLVTVSGPVISPPAPITASTDVITTGFATLAASLAELAEELCGGTITVHKIIDADGNLGTSGDQTDGANWTFNTNVDAPDFSTPASGDTDANGLINFDIDLGFNNAAVVDIIEPGEPGYTFISAGCTKPDGPDGDTDPDPVGTPGAMAVNDIAVGEQDIITCTFYNTAPTTADVKITAQTPTAPPSANAGQTFTLDIKKTMHNNGPASPAPVFISPMVNGPADCLIFPQPGNPGAAVLPMSVPIVVNELFDIRCSQPSAHQFTVFNCIQLDPVSGLTDPNPANNCSPNQIVNVNILGVSDVKVTSAMLTSPPSSPAGVPFLVSATGNVHNNGPDGPTAVDTTFTLNMPPDCSTASANPATVQNTLLNVSVVAGIVRSWNVTCTNPSAHSFTTNISTVIDQLHATDPNPGNNTRVSDPRNTNILVDADVKATAATTSLPPSVIAGTPFTVNGNATIHNNGPYTPANADTTFTLLLPPDCTTTDPNPVVVQNTALPASVATPVGTSWSVTCTTPSTHDFRTMATVAIDQLHVVDPVANNTRTSDTASTAVNATSDVKVTTVTVVSPIDFGAYAPFDVTGQATLHNNGQTGPTSVDTVLSLTMPADCSTPSTNPVGVLNTNLPVSVATMVPAIPATWNVTCTDPGPHVFTVTASVTVDQLHVVDPTLGNNSNSGNDTTEIIPAFIAVCKDVVPNDTTLWDFSAAGPSPGAINSLGDGQCAQFGANMIPGIYTVSEVFQLGYAPSVDCGSNGFQNDVDITFTLDPAEQVTCQYVNAFHPGPNPVGGIAGLITDAGEQAPHSVDSAGENGASNVPFIAMVLAVLPLTAGLGAWALRARWWN